MMVMRGTQPDCLMRVNASRVKHPAAACCHVQAAMKWSHGHGNWSDLQQWVRCFQCQVCVVILQDVPP